MQDRKPPSVRVSAMPNDVESTERGASELQSSSLDALVLALGKSLESTTIETWRDCEWGYHVQIDASHPLDDLVTLLKQIRERQNEKAQAQPPEGDRDRSK